MEDVGHFQDPCIPSPLAEPITLDQGCSGQRFEQESVQSEPSDLCVQERVWEMECRAGHLDTFSTIMSHSFSSQEVINHCLGVCGEYMLQDWFLPKRNSVWPEAKVKVCLQNLALVLEQQSAVDSGICLDQWTLERSQVAQPFNTLKRQLISSISSQRQAFIVLIAYTDYLVSHHSQIEDAMADAAPQAFLPITHQGKGPLPYGCTNHCH